VWLPEKTEFEYQYLVLDADDVVVWSSDVMKRVCMPTNSQASAHVKLYDENTNAGSRTPRGESRTPTQEESVARRTRSAVPVPKLDLAALSTPPPQAQAQGEETPKKDINWENAVYKPAFTPRGKEKALIQEEKDRFNTLSPMAREFTPRGGMTPSNETSDFKENQLKVLNTHLNSAQKKIEEQEGDLTNLRNKYNAKQAGVNSEAEALKTERDTLRGETVALSAQLEQNMADVEVHKKAAETHAATLSKQLEAEKSTLQQLEARAADLQKQLDTAKTSHIASEGELVQTKEELTGVQEALKTREEEIEGLNKAQAGLEALQARCDGFEHELAETKASTSAEIARLTLRIGELEGELDETLAKYDKEYAERRRLHNEVMELKGNIRVFCRIRPMLGVEGAVAVSERGDDEVITTDEASGKIHSFHYDRVFGAKSTQKQVFSEVEPMVTSVVDGYNACIFAYGQTGSGKTHTMMGSPDDNGIIGRGLEHLFDVTTKRSEMKYEFEVTMLEIYNEQVRDLLATGAKQEKNNLDIKQDAATGTMYCPGAVNQPVATMQDVLDFLALGQTNRAVASTNCNSESSRSHCVLSIQIKGEHRETGAQCGSRLHLIDLAGSERLSRSGVEGQQVKEAQSINKSLSSLGDVIAALHGNQKHIPFRNSKLTYLLQDSLSGSSKVLMLMQSSPRDADLNESVCTLRFAERVRATSIGAAKKNAESGDYAQCRQQLSQAKKELQAKTAELADVQKEVRTFEKGSKQITKAVEGAQEEAGRQVASAQRQVEKAQKEAENLRQEIASVNKDKMELRSQLKTAEKVASKSSGDDKVANQLREASKQQETKMKQERERAEAEIKALKQEMKAEKAAFEKEMAAVQAERDNAIASAACMSPRKAPSNRRISLGDIENNAASPMKCDSPGCPMSPASAALKESFTRPRSNSSMTASVKTAWEAAFDGEKSEGSNRRKSMAPSTTPKRPATSGTKGTPIAEKLERFKATKPSGAATARGAGGARRVPMKIAAGAKAMDTGAKRVASAARSRPMMKF